MNSQSLKPKGFFIRPYGQSNVQSNEPIEGSNCCNPLLRKRSPPNSITPSQSPDASQASQPEEKKKKVQTSVYLPMSSSHIFDIFFQNTCPHPHLIFFDLIKGKGLSKLPERKGEKEQKGEKKQGKLIIELLKDYLEIPDILSNSNFDVLREKVVDDWNNRFKDARSEEFILPDCGNFLVCEISHLRSLHYLAYILDIRIFLLFKPQQSAIFNLHLGPNEAKSDFHFMVSSDSEHASLLFEMFDCGYSRQMKFMNLGFETENDGEMAFLHLNNRNPIPYIKMINKPENQEFDNISVSFKDYDDSNLFSFSDGQFVISQIPNCPKVNILYALQTGADQSPNETETEQIKSQSASHHKKINSTFLIAETNNSAYKVVQHTEPACKKPQNDSTTSDMSSFQSFFEYDDNYIKPNQDSIINKFLSVNSIDTKKYIKSFNKQYFAFVQRYIKKENRIPLMLDLASSPLVSLLPFYGLIDVMRCGFAQDVTKIEISTDKLSVIPDLTNTTVFYAFEVFVTNDKQTSLTKQKYEQTYKNIYQEYPYFLAQSVNCRIFQAKSGENKLSDSDEAIIAKDYELIPQRIHSTFPYIKAMINQLLNSDFGLNPIISHAIHRTYFYCSLASLIYYYISRNYTGLNPLLLSNIASFEDFEARITEKYIQITNLAEQLIENGSFPITKHAFRENLLSNGNRPIPEPPFSFISTKFEFDRTNNNLRSISHSPRYRYNFIKIHQNELINDLVEFSITSMYLLRYIYVSRDNVFAIGDDENGYYSYGFCKSLNTELKFGPKFEGQFVSAVYLEHHFTLIVCIKIEDKYQFVFFDDLGNQHKISDNSPLIEHPSEVIKMVVLSQSYFGLIDNSRNVYLFQFTGNEIIRLSRNKNMHLYNNQMAYSILQKALAEKNETKDAFYIFGTRYESLPCIASLSAADGTIEFNNLISISHLGTENHDSANQSESDSTSLSSNLNSVEKLCFNFETENNYLKRQMMHVELNEYEYQNKLLKSNCDNNKSDIIKPMLNYLEIDNDKRKFTLFDINCALAELFPTLVVNNQKIVSYENDSHFALFDFDPQVIRPLSQQIYGYCMYSMLKVNFFTAESMFAHNQFQQYRIVVIVDTCGIGALLSNRLYGTRFDKNEILLNDIWNGFSYSGNIASLILLVRVDSADNDVINIALSNTIQRYAQSLLYEKYNCINEMGQIIITNETKNKNIVLKTENELDSKASEFANLNANQNVANLNANQNVANQNQKQEPNKGVKRSSKHSKTKSSSKKAQPKNDKPVTQIEPRKIIMKQSKKFVALYLALKKFSYLPVQTVIKYSKKVYSNSLPFALYDCFVHP